MKLLGYYLIQPDPVAPQGLSIPCDYLYSLSTCLCDQFPDISCFWGTEEKRTEFAKKMSLDDEPLDHINSLLIENYIIPGNYFSDINAAKTFLHLFKNLGYDPHLLSVHFSEENHKELISIMRETVNFSLDESPVEDDPTGITIGKDIIGFDWASFHSWLCNHLHLDESPISPQFNQFGLLDNSWSEVEELAQRCQGQGEPVIWMPCIIKEHQ